MFSGYGIIYGLLSDPVILRVIIYGLALYSLRLMIDQGKVRIAQYWQVEDWELGFSVGYRWTGQPHSQRAGDWPGFDLPTQLIEGVEVAQMSRAFGLVGCSVFDFVGCIVHYECTFV